MRLCLERIAPVRKGRPIAFDLPHIETSEEIAQASIAPLTEAARRTLETRELAQRIEQLEKITDGEKP